MSARGRANRRGLYYTPAPGIRVASNVTVRQFREFVEFRGTAEALVHTGLLPLHLLPGQPGMPSSVVSLRPTNRSPGPDQYWHRVPGYLVVRRHIDGTFIARLTGYVEPKAPSSEVPEAERQQPLERELLGDSPAALLALDRTRELMRRLAPRSNGLL